VGQNIDLAQLAANKLGRVELNHASFSALCGRQVILGISSLLAAAASIMVSPALPGRPPDGGARIA
jgi:hypothetical protein